MYKPLKTTYKPCIQFTNAVFDEHIHTLRISCPMWIRSTGITGISRVARESIPGVTDKGDGRRGTTCGARGVAVRNRWLSNTRHYRVPHNIGAIINTNGVNF